MEEKTALRSIPFDRLKKEIIDMGLPAYRAEQIFRWMHRGVSGFDEMTDLSKDLRLALSERYVLSAPVLLRKQVSSDETVKFLWQFEDGNAVETVLMKYKHGDSICISTQAGCKMGCVFCASFVKEGKTRDLTAGEMLEQILFSQKETGRQVSNIVLMGTGEPLANYDNVMDFLDVVSHKAGINIGMRHISLSTCGLVPKIYELAEKKLQLTLSISLHAPYDELRSELMPVNKTYPISELITACKHYFNETGRRISFEYAMICGRNDTRECAEKLAALLKGFNCHVNLIPLNRIEGSTLVPSTPKAMRDFIDILEKRHINVTVRRGLGPDINAACGQLRRQALKE